MITLPSPSKVDFPGSTGWGGGGWTGKLCILCCGHTCTHSGTWGGCTGWLERAVVAGVSNPSQRPFHQTGPWVAGLFTASFPLELWVLEDLTRRSSFTRHMSLTSGQCQCQSGLMHARQWCALHPPHLMVYIIHWLYAGNMHHWPDIWDSECNGWHYSHFHKWVRNSFCLAYVRNS